MTKQDFIAQVGLKKRDPIFQEMLIQACLDQPALIADLLENMVSTHANASYFARVLELVVKADASLLLPYLNEFTKSLEAATDQTTLRASAKICELLMVQFELKRMPGYRKSILPHHHDAMITACFDWKITHSATAIQAHAMYALYLLGFTYAWIHPELIQVIEQNIPRASVGYQNRGRKVIKAIVTNTLYQL